jgi:hypothetical protein
MLWIKFPRLVGQDLIKVSKFSDTIIYSFQTMRNPIKITTTKDKLFF